MLEKHVDFFPLRYGNVPYDVPSLGYVRSLEKQIKILEGKAAADERRVDLLEKEIEKANDNIHYLTYRD